MSDFQVRNGCPRHMEATSRSTGPSVARSSLLLPLLLLVATPIECQTAAQYQARVESLRVQWQLRRGEFDSLASTLLSAGIDTIEVGPFTALVDEPIGDLMRQAVPVAWEAIQETLRSDSMLAAARPIYFPTGGSRPISSSPAVVAGLWIGDSADVEDVVNRIILTVGSELGTLLDDGTRLWLSANIMSPTAARRNGWSGSCLASVYVELATSGSAVGRKCFADDLTACRAALELDPASDPIAEWYDTQDLRRFIERVGMARGWGSAEEWIPCVQEGDDAACDRLFRAGLDGSVLHPVSPMAHQTLAETALQIGGDGAYGRMLQTGVTTIADWIAAVAAAPADSVIARWHSNVVAARPAPTTLTAATGWAALAWIVVLATIATRSTRWRS
jgi:hypothetical protein